MTSTTKYDTGCVRAKLTCTYVIPTAPPLAGVPPGVGSQFGRPRPRQARGGGHGAGRQHWAWLLPSASLSGTSAKSAAMAKRPPRLPDADARLMAGGAMRSARVRALKIAPNWAMRANRVAKETTKRFDAGQSGRNGVPICLIFGACGTEPRSLRAPEHGTMCRVLLGERLAWRGLGKRGPSPDGVSPRSLAGIGRIWTNPCPKWHDATQRSRTRASHGAGSTESRPNPSLARPVPPDFGAPPLWTSGPASRFL